jgi:hypothetical protein
MSDHPNLTSKMSTDRKAGIFNRAFWLGSDHSAVNINRFWVYLGGIAFALCAICLVRTITILGKH